jgi:hypothetical protein
LRIVSGSGNGDDPSDTGRTGSEPEALEDVLASIRALVSAETASRLPGSEAGGTVLMLTEEMRIDADPAARSGEVLSDGIEVTPSSGGAPILDEEALRGVVNTIVREELQGELGDRISRNLRKLIRREIGRMLEERDTQPD